VRYGPIAGVPMSVSRVIQGTMMLSSEALDASFALLDEVIENGGNAFDCAHVYGGGDAERVLGAWIEARGVRDKVVIVDKGAHPNADRKRVTPYDIASDLHDSLARLRTDRIDLYLLHRDDPDAPLDEIVDALNQHAEAGRISAYGVSNWSHERIVEANTYAAEHGLRPLAASSPHFSLAEQVVDPWGGCVTLTGQRGRLAREWYAQAGLPVLAWSSLCHGFLSGRYSRADIEAFPDDCEEGFLRWYRCATNLTRLERAFVLAREKGATVPQVATAYLMHQPVDVFALVGSSLPGEFAANAHALDIDLTPEEVAFLEGC